MAPKIRPRYFINQQQHTLMTFVFDNDTELMASVNWEANYYQEEVYLGVPIFYDTKTKTYEASWYNYETNRNEEAVNQNLEQLRYDIRNGMAATYFKSLENITNHFGIDTKHIRDVYLYEKISERIIEIINEAI